MASHELRFFASFRYPLAIRLPAFSLQLQAAARQAALNAQPLDVPRQHGKLMRELVLHFFFRNQIRRGAAG